MQKWKRFEKLAEKIFRELSPKAKIKWDDKILGCLSKRKRQIDVSIQINMNGENILIIVQAKNWKNPAGIDAVEKFISVVEDVRANRGILICRSGFTKDAKVYAENTGIELYNIHDAEKKEWNLEISIPILWKELIPKVTFDFKIHLDKGDIIKWDSSGLILSHDEGQTRVNFLSTFERLWNQNEISKTPGKIHHLESEKPLKCLVIKPDKTKIWESPVSIQLVYIVEEKNWFGHFKPEECRGIVDYLRDEAFYVSSLPIGEIPFKKDKEWKLIEKPNEIAVQMRGTLVATSNWVLIKPGSSEFKNFQIKKMNTLSKYTS